MPYRPTERTEARRLATEERIVEAARRLIAHGGYAEAQVGAVAAEAGVAVGTVYRYFPGKAELLARVFRDASGHEVAAVIEAAAQRRSRRRGRGSGPRSRPSPAGAEQRAPRLRPAGRTRRSPGRGRAPRLPPRLPRRLRRRHHPGVRQGELPAQDVELSAAALVGAIGEALVGPVSPTAERPARPTRTTDRIDHRFLHTFGHGERNPAMSNLESPVSDGTHEVGNQADAAVRLQRLRGRPRARRGARARGRRLGARAGRRGRRLRRRRGTARSWAGRQTRTRRGFARTTASATGSTRSSSTPPGTS